MPAGSGTVMPTALEFGELSMIRDTDSFSSISPWPMPKASARASTVAVIFTKPMSPSVTAPVKATSKTTPATTASGTLIPFTSPLPMPSIRAGRPAVAGSKKSAAAKLTIPTPTISKATVPSTARSAGPIATVESRCSTPARPGRCRRGGRLDRRSGR
jgi:hypothetical protein